MRPRLLITGFGPFPRVPSNPSALLARRLASHPRLRRALGVAPRLLVMRTAYAAIHDELEPALAERPEAVLMIGVAMRARRIRVEGRARNRVSRLFPDATGAVARRLALEPGGPAERASPAAARIRVALRGVGALASRDAGRYLCNASYYRVLAEGCPAVFLHVPPLPGAMRPLSVRRPRSRSLLDAWTDAFAEAALTLVPRAGRAGVRRRAAAAPG